MTTSQPIDVFLDDLYRRLRGNPRTARRLLAEAEAHLRDSAAALQATGMDAASAEREAVDRFGTPAEIAAQSAGAVSRRLGALARAGVLLGGIGLVAVGVSGGIAALMNAVSGRDFVGALHQTYPGAACRHFLAVQPSAGDCAHAAILENSDDAVILRLLAGLAGLVLLALAWGWRRARRQSAWTGDLPAVFVPAVGATAFGVAAAGLAAQSIDLAVVGGSDGVGFYLSGALAAALGCLVFAIPLARQVLVGQARDGS